MANVTLNAPAGASEVHISGLLFRAAANGTITADSKHQAQLIAAGCTLPGTAPGVYATAKRPTTGLYAGMGIFDSTLGKPVWRNAANSGWVDATGTAA